MEDWIPVSECPWVDFSLRGWERLNPMQARALHFLMCRSSLLVSAPSSAGKTAVGEMAVGLALSEGDRAFYLVPLRFLAREKYQDWEACGLWGASEVALHMGGHGADREKLARASVVVTTYEAFDSLARRRSPALDGVGTLVLDEAHLLGQDGRGPALECALMNFRPEHPACRIVGLSATAPNMGELAEWLQAEHLSTDWRPVPLDITVRRVDWSDRPGRVKAAVELVRGLPAWKVLVFGHSRSDVREFAKVWGDEKECAFLHAGLGSRAKERAERLFRDGDLRVLASTSVVGQGLNLPARAVVVMGMRRGRDRVTCSEVLQMLGRAGRTGLDERGDGYVLTRERGLLLEPEEVRSRLAAPGALEFHLVAEIDRQRTTNSAELGEWLAGSFYSRGGGDGAELVDRTVSKLLHLKAAACRNGDVMGSRLGGIASRFYLDPASVLGWERNLDALADSAASDRELCLAFGCVPRWEADWIPWDADRLVKAWLADGGKVRASPGELLASYGFWCLLGKQGAPGIRSTLGELRGDLSRLMAAWEQIDWRGSPVFWRRLAYRFQTGCGWETACATVAEPEAEERRDVL